MGGTVTLTMRASWTKLNNNNQTNTKDVQCTKGLTPAFALAGFRAVDDDDDGPTRFVQGV